MKRRDRAKKQGRRLVSQAPAFIFSNLQPIATGESLRDGRDLAVLSTGTFVIQAHAINWSLRRNSG